MHTLQLDGRIVEFTEGQTLLEVARENGVEIPTLCHHAGVENEGACRLCTVEISRPEWSGWTKLVTSCEYLAEDGLVVATDSDEVVSTRRTLVDLLLARNPETPKIRALGREYGLAKTSFVPREEPDDCILCGICVRVCAAVGAHAIATAGRGVEKAVGLPFDDDSSACVGCLSCAHACPTGHITFEETSATRTIWGRTFQRERCSVCGAPLGTPEQFDLFAQTKDLPRSYFTVCDSCRKRQTAESFYALIAPGEATR